MQLESGNMIGDIGVPTGAQMRHLLFLGIEQKEKQICLQSFVPLQNFLRTFRACLTNPVGLVEQDLQITTKNYK